ncbi:MAG: HipA domain-containing protein [Methanococcaceae archaeon]
MNRCPSCLREGFETFCGPCSKRLFGGKKVDPILPFTKPEFMEVRLNNSTRLSISGLQIKYSAKLEGKKLIITEKAGEYILKPVPIGTFKDLNEVPANEHLSMQLAGQIFKINTPPNALMHFADGEQVYIVKRFDVLPDGKKMLQEDFAQVAEKSEETGGKNYKYDFSYEEIAALMKKFLPAYMVEVEKYFRLVLFNYIICNGDAHLKNFSLLRTIDFGDYKLSPAYDLMNTSIHVPGERDTALELFADSYMTEAFKYGNKYTRIDFEEFGVRIGLVPTRVAKIIDSYISVYEKLSGLVERSFLSEFAKDLYLFSAAKRIERIKN